VGRGPGRPATMLVDLVLEGRFDATNQRHRRKLDEDDSLLDRFWPGWWEASYFDLTRPVGFEDPERRSAR
jgi:hypothetical protein